MREEYMGHHGTVDVNVEVKNSNQPEIGMKRYAIILGGESVGWVIRWEHKNEWEAFCSNKVRGVGSKYQGYCVDACKTRREAISSIIFEARWLDGAYRAIAQAEGC
jgi:hypothetical protein